MKKKSFIFYFQLISYYFLNLLPKIRWSFIFLLPRIISQPIKEFETKKKQKTSFPPLFILWENCFCYSPKLIPGWHFSAGFFLGGFFPGRFFLGDFIPGGIFPRWLFSGWHFSGWHFLGGIFPRRLSSGWHFSGGFFLGGFFPRSQAKNKDNHYWKYFGYSLYQFIIINNSFFSYATF